MKLATAINLAAFNIIALVLAVLIAQDQAWRLSYWRSMGFTSTTTYYPFFLITSATNGTAYIPGTLTLDWLQVILAVMAVVDIFAIIGYVRRRSVQAQAAVPQPG